MLISPPLHGDLATAIEKPQDAEAQGGRLVELKTAHSRRCVPMPPGLKKALQEHQARLIVDGPENPLELVFPSAVGTPIEGANLLRRIYWPTLSRAGLRRLKFHSLRHSYATIRLNRGRSLIEVSAWLGHHDVAVTAKVYAHYLPRNSEDTPDELEAAIFKESETPVSVPAVA